MFRPLVWWADKQRVDVMYYNDKDDKEELENNLRTGKHIISKHRIALIDIITRYWDCFCPRGAMRTILDYIFCIDTWGSPPVCCRRPVYGPHEKPIILDLITALKDNY